jgi:hypothetical protein
MLAVIAVSGHERLHPPDHADAELAPTAHIVDQPRIAHRKTAKFGGRHLILPQKAFDFSHDQHVFFLLFRRTTRAVEPI